MKSQGVFVSEVLGFLNNTSLFSELGESSAKVLAHACRFQRIKKGEILFFQSDVSEHVYVVRTGVLSIILNSPDGRDMVINEMRVGDIFGELGVLTKLPRSTSAMARTESELLVIPCQIFLRILDDEPQLARRLLCG
jgi:CRP/FNR family cyclic AMP-dependent transcriptional regulator